MASHPARRWIGGLPLPLLLALGALAYAPLGAMDRAGIDAWARDRAGPPRSLVPELPRFASDLLGWTARRLLVDQAEEWQRVQAQHEAITAARSTAELPEHVRLGWEQLLAALPPAQRPGDWPTAVVVLDEDEPLCFTPGAGVVYLSRGLLAELDGRPASLAFCLAHQLGHSLLGHTRRAHALALTRAAPAQWGRRDWSRLLDVRLTGEPGRYVFAAWQEHAADRFALQLGRLAGWQAADLLDYARLRAARLRAGDERFADAPRRLVALLEELDGVVADGERYGLFELGDGEPVKAPDAVGAADQPAVVFLHGLQSDLHAHAAAETWWRTHSPAVRRLHFRFPNDQSVERSARLLRTEIRRVLGPEARPLLVGYSAGGIVARYYIERLDGGFDRLACIGTPHGGSDLAQLTMLVEAKEFARFLLQGDPAGSLAGIVIDGREELAVDLQPGSLLLAELAGPPASPDRYRDFIGRLVDERWAAAADLAMLVGRRQLRELIERERPRLLDQGALARSLDRLALPGEFTRGDLAVRSDRATLTGVGHEVYRVAHPLLPRDRRVIADVHAWLTDPDR